MRRHSSTTMHLVSGACALLLIGAAPALAQKEKLSAKQVFDKALQRPMSKGLQRSIADLQGRRLSIIQKGSVDYFQGGMVVPQQNRVAAVDFGSHSMLGVAMGRTGKRSWDLFVRRAEPRRRYEHRSKTLPSGLTLEVTKSSYRLLGGDGAVVQKGKLRDLEKGALSPRPEDRARIRQQLGISAADLNALLGNHWDTGVRYIDD